MKPEDQIWVGVDTASLARAFAMTAESFVQVSSSAAQAGAHFQAAMQALALGRWRKPPTPAERARTLEHTCQQMYARIRELEQQLEERNP